MDESENRYKQLFEAAPDGLLMIDPETAQIENVNTFLINLLGYSRDTYTGKRIWETEPFKNSKLSEADFQELLKLKYRRLDDLTVNTSNGSGLSVEFICTIYNYNGKNAIQCNIRDNTKRHLEQLALKAANRQLAMLSESNMALLSEKNEELLLKDYCRIAVEAGGYRMAWVGIALNDDEKTVKPIAHYGVEEGYLALAKITWSDTEHGRGPTGSAIRTGQVQFIEDFAQEPRVKPWRNEALARGYHSSIALPFRITNDVMACLTIYCATPNIWSLPEQKLLLNIANELGLGINHFQNVIATARYQEKLRNSLELTIQLIADTVEKRDPYTARHQRRVAQISTKIAEKMGLSSDRIHGLHLAASIHDLGKIGVPAEILSKPSKLTDAERILVHEHPKIGFEIVEKVEFPWPIKEMILQHHERIDGSGYPHGLTGDQILLETKILTVADVVEAMSSHRPYRPALGINVALAEIENNTGTLFDPAVVDACLKLFREDGYHIEE